MSEELNTGTKIVHTRSVMQMLTALPHMGLLDEALPFELRLTFGDDYVTPVSTIEFSSVLDINIGIPMTYKLRLLELSSQRLTDTEFTYGELFKMPCTEISCVLGKNPKNDNRRYDVHLKVPGLYETAYVKKGD